MSDQWIIWGLSLAAIATGLVAGVFLAFSDFGMRSLKAVQAAAGVAAMQAINRKVYRSVFMVLLLGMSAVSAAISASAHVFVTGAALAWLTAGGLLYLVGVFLVTIFCNVPMNKQLDGMAHDSASAQAYWPVYVSAWTRWNHVRSGASLGSAVCYVVGAILLSNAA